MRITFSHRGEVTLAMCSSHVPDIDDAWELAVMASYMMGFCIIKGDAKESPP